MTTNTLRMLLKSTVITRNILAQNSAPNVKHLLINTRNAAGVAKSGKGGKGAGQSVGKAKRVSTLYAKRAISKQGINYTRAMNNNLLLEHISIDFNPTGTGCRNRST